MQPDFVIKNKGAVSEEFLKRNIATFKSACEYVALFPYHRNLNKDDIRCLFSDNCGTCSTKHATLRKLAVENGFVEIELILGIFKMDATYTHRIKQTLGAYNLDYIPEAHNYLGINKMYFDFTKPNAQHDNIKGKLLFETVIEYNQINRLKNEIHKKYLAQWIIDTNQPYTIDEIWAIREQCIMDLQESRNPD